MRQNQAYINGLKKISPNEIDPQKIGEIFEELAYYYLETKKGLSMKGEKGAPDWFGYETALWKISEMVRPIFRKKKNLRGKNPVLDSFEKLSKDRRFKKGRQNIVLMLGEYGKGEYIDALGALLHDKDVYGHSIKALTRSKAPGFKEIVLEILSEEKVGWIKTAAKKYIEKS